MLKHRLLILPALLPVVMLFPGCAGNAGSVSAAAPINVVSREDGSGTRGAFIELFGVEVKEGDTKKDHTTDEAVIVSKTDVMLTMVAGDKNAIGYVSIGSLNDTVKALAIDGTAATSANVKNGTYGISRPFNIAIKGQAEGLTKDFVDFILSSDGQQVVSGSCVSVDDNAQPFAGSHPQGRLVIAGSSSVSPVMEKLAEAYKNINTNAAVEIQTSDSTAGMTAAIEGNCDIGMASRGLKDSEKEMLTEITIAIDGIAVIVSKDNAVDGLSKEQVQQVYTGEVTSWSGLNQ